MATIPDYRKELTEEDQAAVERYIGMYNDATKTAQAGIDKYYAPAIAEQKSQLAALPQQYDSLRHQNDYELEVAARRFNDMMAMEGQKNSGLNRTEQAGLQAAHSQTSGNIAVQQKAAEQEIQNAISQILAEREKAKSDAALQYQTMGLQAASDRANQILSNYRDDAMTGWAYDQSEKEIMMNHQNDLARDEKQQGYTQDNMKLQSQLNMDEITHSTDEGIRRDNNSAENDRTNTLYAAQVETAYGGGSTSDLSDYIENGMTLGKSLSSQYMKKDKVTGKVAYADETTRAAVAQMIFDRYFHVTAGYDEKGNTKLNYESNFGGDAYGDAAMSAFEAAISAAGLTGYSGYEGLAKLAQTQLRNRSASH